MSRDDGFLTMDLSTNFLDDPKLRTIWRRYGVVVWMRCALLYLGIATESWKSGHTVDVEGGCPILLTIDESELDAAVAAMVEVGLLDGDPPTIPAATFASHYGTAKQRRDAVRERWARANAKRTARSPRGDDAVTSTSVRPSDRPSDRHAPPRAVARTRATDESPSRTGTLREAMAAMGLKTEVP